MSKFNINVVFVNDRPLARAGMKYIAHDNNAIELVNLYETTDELIRDLPTIRCDVAVIDYSVHGRTPKQGLSLLSYLRRTYPRVRIVILLAHENAVLIRSILRGGVTSIISKFDDLGHIVSAIHVCYGGGSYLSPTIKHAIASDSDDDVESRTFSLTCREAEVLRMFFSGMSISQIAAELRKGKQTISAQKMNAMKKLGLKNDIELIRYSEYLGLSE
ncbi:helix-turn-helix transcriptional regulator [Burkholderia multivorans]|uniref:response regulator transcription factor n=1 Tax=Burkholderia multivorans TaxID=87883 RepID=UPI000CFF9D31|nr:response regulator transcription factor [Burkholderia multivorans]PRF71556.1 helix-turn-helix transcriptional regulator [Burkholderia multivorans]